MQSGSNQGGAEPFAHGSFARPLRECYGEHPLSVLGYVVVRISGAVIRLYVGEGEFPGHVDQGDLIREGSVSVGVGVALLDGGSYPREPLCHPLLLLRQVLLYRVWALICCLPRGRCEHP